MALLSMQKLTGLVQINDNGLYHFAQGTLIEVFKLEHKSSGDAAPGKWLGAASVRYDGLFELFMEQSEDPGFYCSISSGGNVVNIPDAILDDDKLNVGLQQSQYKQLYGDTRDCAPVIKGHVSLGPSHITAYPLSGNISVAIFASGMADAVLMGQGAINIYGNYEIYIDKTQLQSPAFQLAELSCSAEQASQKFYACIVDSDAPGNVIARSVDLSLNDCCTIVDLHIDEEQYFELFYFELYYLALLLQHFSPEIFSQLQQTPEDINIRDLFLSTNVDIGLLMNLVYAFCIQVEYGIEVNIAYAFCKGINNSIKAWAETDEERLYQLIITARQQYWIGEINDLEEALAIIRPLRTTWLSEDLAEDGTSIMSLLSTVFPGEQASRRFIEINLQYANDSVKSMSDALVQEFGENEFLRIQYGLQTMAITGMQKEIAEELILNRPPLRTLAIDYQPEDWQDLVSIVCSTHQKKCIPLPIQEEAGDDEQLMIQLYGNKLYNLVTDTYATAILGDKFENGLFSFSQNPQQTAEYINANPTLDLRTHNIWHFDEDIPVAVRKDLQPVQNLLKVAEGKPQLVTQMLINGIRSSSDIAEMSPEVFVATYAAATPGLSTAALAQIHAKATTTSLVVASTQALVTSAVFSPGITLPGFSVNLWNPNPGPSVNPNLETLFGSLDLCNCSECTSMYSPAAYYTDILNFIKSKLATTPPKVYNELIRRRPDLVHIDLSCKNTNTVMPYIDLVNELLELAILKANNIAMPAQFKSYQTSAASLELEAYPEHTYKDNTGTYLADSTYETVYNNILSNAVFGNTLPFSLPLEESRTYLAHLGYTRYELMMKFNPVRNYTNITTSTGINEFNAMCEWLHISRPEADIITRLFNSSPVMDVDKQYYGYANTPASIIYVVYLLGGNPAPGDHGEKGLNNLLKRAGIGYKELLELLNTDFLNKEISAGVRPLLIKPSNVNNPFSCRLDELILYMNSGGLSPLEFLNRLYRFLRLKKALGWSTYQLDMVLGALNIVFLKIDDFRRIARLHQLCAELKTSPEQLSAFVKRLSTATYINYDNDNQNNLPTVYETLFKNKALVNPPETYFNNPDAIVGSYQERSGTIVAAFNIKEEEFYMLLDFLGINKTSAIPAGTGLNILSRIYGLVQLAKGTNLSIKDLLRVLKLSDTNVPILLTAAPDYLIDWLSTLKIFIDKSKALLFSLQEVDYLLANRDDDGIFIPQNAEIQLFYESLRAELKKLVTGADNSTSVSADLKNALYNICTQKFGTAFGLKQDTIYYLVSQVISISTTLTPPNTPLMEALIRTEFINAVLPPPATGPDPLTPLPIIPGNSVGIFGYAALYDAYRRIHKIAYLSSRYKLSAPELEFFINNAARLDILAIDALPITTPAATSAQVSGLLRLNDWIKVKGLYNLRTLEYLDILKASLGTTSKIAWQQLILDRTKWKLEDLTFLTGDASTTGILDTLYSNTVINNEFRKGSLLLQLFDLMSAVGRIGLSPALTYNALKTNLQMADARNIRKAAKAKYSDVEWSKVAKPLQDTLRERQRRAMVAYLVVRPEAGDPVGSQVRWKDENGLFAYYLIDVAMQPCMKTSRIKQAISSVQLYMDRTILNLENVNGIPTNHITIRPDLIAQWKSWRKWYRVWEANRKVFLYPENWIEPELRDNKTPFFRELETQLLQDEVKDDKVEDALRTYLEQVEEVGRLDPVSTYHQIEKDSSGKVIIDRTHVIARTSVLPHRYFYRILENKEWTPWEKVNADIKSDHVIPVIWNRKLYLFWLTFRTKTPKEEEMTAKRTRNNNSAEMEWIEALNKRGGLGRGLNAIIPPNESMEGYGQLDINLSWSQYKDNKWLAPEIAKDIMSIDMSRAILSTIAQNAMSNQDMTQKVYNWLNNRGDIKLDELFRNRLYFYHTFDDTGNESAGINFSIMFAAGLDETATGIHAFFWRGDNSKDPYVVRNAEKGYQILAPMGTRFNKMKFVEDPFGDGKLRRDNTSYSAASTTSNSYFSFSTFRVETYPGIVRGSNNTILDITNNGPYTVAARASNNADPHYHFHNPMLSEFLFDDVKNTYFVQWEDTLLYAGISQISTLSLGSVSGFSAVSYTGGTGGISGSLSGLLNTTTPSLSGNILTNIFQAGGYRFHTFYHPQIFNFIKALNKDGIPGLLSVENQRQTYTMEFQYNYQPTSLVLKDYPENNVQFKTGDAYSIYNWEIFFHAPMLIAQRLSDNQQFEQAQKWYHYIFDPTSNTNINGSYSAGIERFWKFYPFYKQSTEPVQTLSDLLVAINNGVGAAVAQVTKWEQNPFNPHLIARMRILAYMKNVLMKYLDNLIAWGDQLFRRDTIESINEATQLYILATNLLGDRPKEIMSWVKPKPKPKTFEELSTGSGLDALSNAMVNIEGFFAPNIPGTTGPGSTGAPVNGKMFYFCLPKNDKLMSYWDTLADRLFKIRNCMNIEGIIRQLPLFEPPIDPALLVRATAMGVDINSVLNSVSGASLPHYRFSYMLQKANEVCNEVKALGGALLSALEKKDGEELALLRSGHELKMMERIRSIREQQVLEAEENLEALKLTKESIEIRHQYYSSRVFMNPNEQKHLQSIQTGLVLQAVQSAMFGTISALALIPQFHGQGPMAIGASFGGDQLSRATNAINAGLTIASVINNAKGSMAATLGGYERRRDDWSFQADTAAKELEQIDKQLLAAEIRLDIARKELSNQELQVEQTTEADNYMRSKFTNKELYSWMSSQVAATYFQSYQLAYDLAKRTEECFKNELPAVQAPVGGFIKFGYWDSLRKGLLSGDKLQFDLRKMEASYIDSNRRELELSKSFSLALTDPEALINLRKDGTCMFNLDKIWFDLDFPGHYLRKIKSVSISIPCVAGPYTTIAATLQMTANTIMKTDAVSDAGETVKIATNAIATSTGQNDAGMFELNFRDERYMPFENAGVISSWRLSMMEDAGLRQLDYDNISDVIIHVNYTARHSGTKVGPTVIALNEQLNALSTGIELPRYFSLKHEFSNEWYAGFSSLTDIPGTSDAGREMNLVLKRSMFPQYAKDKDIQISAARFMLRPKQEGVYKLISGSTVVELDNDIALTIGFAPDDTEKAFSFILYKEVEIAGNLVPAAIMEEELLDLYFILSYKLG